VFLTVKVYYSTPNTVTFLDFATGKRITVSSPFIVEETATPN
jgi:hypothetical protein